MNTMVDIITTDNDLLVNGNITSFKRMDTLEQTLNAAWRLDESEAVSRLLASLNQETVLTPQIQQLSVNIAQKLRDRKASSGKSGIVQGLLQEFSLSSNEGVALMCLAEALLRIPDKNTRDLLIKDKINQGNWREHIGQSNLMFVNAATWGLIITDKLVETPDKFTLSSMLTRLIGQFGKGIIRKSVDIAMRIMGEQFVTGETIQQALSNSERLQAQGFRYSYDMLGEAALTEADAWRYFNDYVQAIENIGKASNGAGIYQGPGISIKLSALHPRYQRSQIERVHAELYPKVLKLAELAKHYDIGLNIDAEESERLELSLGLLERLCFEPRLQGWNGIGFVIQAYQKRCFYLIDYIVDLAKRSQHRLMIRLVKGAYWDSEIKKAQLDGVTDFPVFTRKVHTDVSYIACAKKLLAAPQQVYPQFATHNAQSLASIYYMANPAQYYAGQYEFQCLHGMGEPLYEQVVGNIADGKLGVPCRIYAPVGTHETLLAYLVRRLLENGANTSFVNRIADKSISIEDLVSNPLIEIAATASKEGQLGLSHPLIAKPKALYGAIRANSNGYDLNNDSVLRNLCVQVKALEESFWSAQPLLADTVDVDTAQAQGERVLNPSNHHDIVGYVQEASLQDVAHALDFAAQKNASWAAMPAAHRADLLLLAADALEQRMAQFMVLLSRESGKTYQNGIAEVREAVDFLRYYAAQAKTLQGNPSPLGTVLCISPWNFPLAIFIGQVSAALVAGNTVIAKPAEQTPLVAAEAIKLLWQAGVPKAAVQLLPGRGEIVGAALSRDERVNGIMFTGSTEVAKILQKTVAARVTQAGKPVPLIAETGGQNAMIVDPSALTEQVVLDVVNSAFDSAGQRCSALRLLCVQEDNYAAVVNMLKGAMGQLNVADPKWLNSDIGPVIDAEAKQNIVNHIAKMRAKGYPIHQISANDVDVQADQNSTFVLPTMIELPNLEQLDREIFGPVLHVITYKYGELDSLMDAINGKGYGLTMGLHTRIDDTIQRVIGKAKVGNLYINRNIVGAVVGVQPFGGEGMSGTGPKAGGPLYLHKLMATTQPDVLSKPFGVKQAISHPALPQSDNLAFYRWVARHLPLIKLMVSADMQAVNQAYELPGPTGESNLYSILPREAVLSLGNKLQDQVRHVHAILAIGSQAYVLKDSVFAQEVYPKLPADIQARIHVAKQLRDIHCDVVIHQGSREELLATQSLVASSFANIVTVLHLSADDVSMENQHIPVLNLVHERALSINTTAAGGNTSLMMLASDD